MSEPGRKIKTSCHDGADNDAADSWASFACQGALVRTSEAAIGAPPGFCQMPWVMDGLLGWGSGVLVVSPSQTLLLWYFRREQFLEHQGMIG